jgi:hypothetical protein
MAKLLVLGGCVLWLIVMCGIPKVHEDAKRDGVEPGWTVFYAAILLGVVLCAPCIISGLVMHALEAR